MNQRQLELRSKPTGYRIWSMLLLSILAHHVINTAPDQKDGEFYFLTSVLVVFSLASILSSIYDRVLRIDLDKDNVFLRSCYPYLIGHRNFPASSVKKILVRSRGSGLNVSSIAYLSFVLKDGSVKSYMGYSDDRRIMVEKRSEVAAFIGIDDLGKL